MQLFRFDSVDSTNELAKRMIREGRIRESCCVVAREQTAGRGSRGRSWVSPRDAGIYLTIVDLPSSASARNSVSASAPDTKGASRPRTTSGSQREATGASPRNTTIFTLATGVACAEILRETTGLDVRLKPVNDLYLDGGKLGGILTEAIIQGDRLLALLTGIGINTHLAERNLAPVPDFVADNEQNQTRSSSRAFDPPESPLGKGGGCTVVRPTSLQEHMPVDAFAHLDIAALIDRLVERVTTWHSIAWRGETSRIEARWNELRIPGAAPCSDLRST